MTPIMYIGYGIFMQHTKPYILYIYANYFIFMLSLGFSSWMFCIIFSQLPNPLPPHKRNVNVNERCEYFLYIITSIQRSIFLTKYCTILCFLLSSCVFCCWCSSYVFRVRLLRRSSRGLQESQSQLLLLENRTGHTCMHTLTHVRPQNTYIYI